MRASLGWICHCGRDATTVVIQAFPDGRPTTCDRMCLRCARRVKRERLAAARSARVVHLVEREVPAA